MQILRTLRTNPVLHPFALPFALTVPTLVGIQVGDYICTLFL